MLHIVKSKNLFLISMILLLWFSDCRTEKRNLQDTDWPLLYYYDTDYQACYRWHETWISCEDPRKCTQCNQITSLTTDQLWLNWTSGFRLSDSCESWSSSWSNFWYGTNSNQCLSWPTNQWLDLDTTTWYSSCPSGTTAITSENYSILYHPHQTVNYWRKTLEYYVDSSSTSSIELGTINYPFKHIYAPAKELFNLFSGSVAEQIKATIYIKSGTYSYLFTEQEYILFLKSGSVTISTYSPSTGNAIIYMINHLPGALSTSTPEIVYTATYHSFEQTEYNLDYRVSVGDMTSEQAVNPFTKIAVFSTSLRIENLMIYTNITQNSYNNTLIVAYSDDLEGGTGIIVENWLLDIDLGIFYSEYSAAFSITNSQIYVTSLMYAIKVHTTQWLSIDSGIEISVENNTFLGTFEKGVREFIEVNTALHFSFKNNSFDKTFVNSVENVDYFVNIKTTCESISNSYMQQVTISKNEFSGLAETKHPFLITYNSLDVNTDRSSKWFFSLLIL